MSPSPRTTRAGGTPSAADPAVTDPTAADPAGRSGAVPWPGSVRPRLRGGWHRLRVGVRLRVRVRLRVAVTQQQHGRIVVQRARGVSDEVLAQRRQRVLRILVGSRRGARRSAGRTSRPHPGLGDAVGVKQQLVTGRKATAKATAARRPRCPGPAAGRRRRLGEVDQAGGADHHRRRMP